MPPLKSHHLLLAGLASGCLPTHSPPALAPHSEHSLDAGVAESEADAGSRLDALLDAYATLEQDVSSRVILATESSPFGTVYVLEEGDLRIMRFDSLESFDQSAISLSDPKSIPVEYVRYSLLGLAYPSRVQRVGMIGLGGGSFSNLVHEHLPQVTIDAVDINPVVVDLARRFFHVQDDPRYRLIVQDGAAFLAATRNRYDLLLIDAYAGENIPDALASTEFFRLTRTRLSRGGVIVLNVAVQGAAEEMVLRHFHEVFPTAHCYEAPVDGNIVVIGVNGPIPPHEALSTRVQQLDRTFALPYALHGMFQGQGQGPAQRCRVWTRIASPNAS